MRRSVGIWGGRAAAAVVVAGLVIYLCLVGLDKADKLASVLGLLVAVAALLGPYLLPPSGRSDSTSRAEQVVSNAVVGKHLTQLRGAKSVRVQGGPAPGSALQAAPPGAPSAAEAKGGQYVNGVWVGGNVTQVDGTDGEVTVG